MSNQPVPMKTASLVACAVLAACSVPEGSLRSAPSPAGPSSIAESGVPLLGIGFGRLVTIEAESTFGDGAGKGDTEPALRIMKVDGERAPDGVLIPWTYGGWVADHPEPTGRDGFSIDTGRIYLLRGYETGGWIGIPPDVHTIFAGEMPPQYWNFHFRRVFRVIDGRVLARPSGP